MSPGQDLWANTGRPPAGQGAFAEVITAAVERLRSSGRAQAVSAAPVAVWEERAARQEGTDVAAKEIPAQPATEWHKGALAAHDLVIRQVEAGHSADHIAGTWEQALASYDDATATGGEREWHAGAAETAADMIQTLRDTERAEAEQAQAARDDAGTCDCGYPACRSGALPSVLQARPAQAARDSGKRQAAPEAEAEPEAG